MAYDIKGGGARIRQLRIQVLYGYQIEDGKLVPQPQEAAVVSRIFALCLEGKFQWEILSTSI